jgi:hypothetical protein
MDLGLVVVSLVDGNSCVGHMGLDGFLVNNWLNGFVNVLRVMLVL